MKTSSDAGKPKRIDKATAWGVTLANLAGLPGLGSIAAGRRVGYFQGFLALVGFGLSLLWMVLVVRDWRTEGRLPTEFRPSLWIGIAGVGIWGCGWLWALRTSIALHREARPPVLHEAPKNRGSTTPPGPTTPPRL